MRLQLTFVSIKITLHVYHFLAPTYQIFAIRISTFLILFLNSEIDVLNFGSLFQTKDSQKYIEFVPKIFDLIGKMKSTWPYVRL